MANKSSKISCKFSQSKIRFWGRLLACTHILLYHMKINFPNAIELVRFLITKSSIKLGWCYYDYLLLCICDSSNVYAINEIFNEGLYDIPLQKNPKIIVDIGSNIGDSVLFFSKKYPMAIIHAFEPNKRIFNYLKINIHHYMPESHIYLYPLAVTQKNHVLPLTLYIPNNLSGGGTTSVKYLMNQYEHIKKYQINSISFAQLMNKIPKIDLLKVDIEGAEHELLPSFLRYANRIAMIILELHYNPTTDNSILIYKFMYQLSNRYDLSIYAPASKMSNRVDLVKNFFTNNFKRNYTLLVYGKSKNFI